MNRLSVKDCHIYIEQGLQREGSHRKDKQLPQAIDVALNSAQSRIIRSRIKPDPNNPNRFEINQVFVSDIQMLISLDVEIPVYVDTINKKSYGVLPYDFGYLLSSKSFYIEDCQEGFSIATQSSPERIISIPFTSTKSSAPYYTQVVVGVGANNITINTVGFQSLVENSSLVDDIINAYKNLGVSAYWETYKDLSIKDNFLIVTRDTSVTATLQVDNTSSTPTNKDSTITVFKTTPVGKLAANRDLKADFLDSSQLNSKYHKSTPRSPIAALAKNTVQIIGSERFLANRILVSYIRKPKRINLTLNQASELSPSVHEPICDLAIQILKKQVEDQTYPVEVQDNKVRIE